MTGVGLRWTEAGDVRWTELGQDRVTERWLVAAATLSGAGAFAPRPAVQASVALAGAASVSPAPRLLVRATVNMVAAGTISPAAGIPSSFTLAGGGTLSATPRLAVAAATTRSAAGTMTAAGAYIWSGAASFLNSVPRWTEAGSARAIEAGTPRLIEEGGVRSALRATPAVVGNFSGNSLLSATTTLSAHATVPGLATATLAGSGTLSAAPRLSIAGAVALTGGGDIAADTSSFIFAGAAFTPQNPRVTEDVLPRITNPVFDASVYSPPAFDIGTARWSEGQGLRSTMTLAGVVTTSHVGLADLSAVGSVAPTPRLALLMAANLNGSGQITATFPTPLVGEAALAGAGTMDADGAIIVLTQASASFVANGNRATEDGDPRVVVGYALRLIEGGTVRSLMTASAILLPPATTGCLVWCKAGGIWQRARVVYSNVGGEWTRVGVVSAHSGGAWSPAVAA